MKAGRAYLRSFVISPEFALLVASALIVSLRPAWVEWVASKINSTTQDYFEAALVAPLLLGGVTLQMVRAILFPDKDENGELHLYKGYQEIKVVANVAVAYAALFAVMGIAAALNLTPQTPGLPTFLLSVAVIGSAIVTATCWSAHIQINELFARFNAGKPRN